MKITAAFLGFASVVVAVCVVYDLMSTYDLENFNE